jgi:hypothetical protein
LPRGTAALTGRLQYEKGTNRMFFSRFVELASVYGTTPEQIMAEV